MTARMVRTARALLAVLAFAVPGASASAGSNLPGDGYPAPACGERPEVPDRPGAFETEQAIAEYNAEVEAYNASMERFAACMERYVANAKADLRRIRKMAGEAIERVNR